MVLGWILAGGLVGSLGGYFAVSLVAAARMLRPYRKTSQIAPGDVGLHYEDVWLKARGEELTIAAWHIPAEQATRAIILAHGVGGCRGHDYSLSSLHLVTELVESGFTVLMIDLRGHGESDAAWMTYGMSERRDVLGAVDWLLERGYQPGSIGVLGLSMGGVAGLGAACEDRAIAALIIDSACADFMQMMRAHFRRTSKLPKYFLLGTVFMARFLTGERLETLRPAEMLRTVPHLKVLIFHGSKDRLVPLEHGEALARAAQTDLVVTQQAGHLGSFKTDPRGYTRRVLQFFKASLEVQPVTSPILQHCEVGATDIQIAPAFKVARGVPSKV